MKDLNTLVIETGMMPILFAETADCVDQVLGAIQQTEIPAVEILQRGEIAKQVLKDAALRKKNAYIGAGTVCTLDKCKEMVDLGADFIVSPGYNAEVVDWCVKHNIPVVPGVSNPSEVMMAANAGVRIAKFFPFYELGGEPFLNGISGPFPEMKFIITGATDDRQLHYLSNPKIAAIGGVWMFQSETNHTVLPEAEIVSRINRSISIAKHYKTRTW